MNRIKRAILNWLLKDLFNAVTEKDVLHSLPNGALVRHGKELSNAEVHDLVTGAQSIKALSIYKVLTDDLKMAANRRIYLNSNTTDDIVFGKAMLYCIDLLERKVSSISHLKK